ncbi:MAG: hypothetical protein MUO21_01085 [Nitrososphaeraceae archaeon]|nr:hypothetical protein [Nitrososphaeraceae archaeon]
MNITSDKLCMLALLVIIVISLVQIYNYMYRTEHMNPALLTHQIEDLSSKPGDPVEINFYVRGDRFASDKKLCPKLETSIPQGEGIKCGPQMNWNTYAVPGANNVYGDMVWNHTSPRMVLESNAMSCGSQAYNAPSGIPSGPGGCGSNYELSQSLNEFGTVGALSDQYFLNSPENLEKFVNL